MDPREYLLRYFTDLDKIDIPINVKDNQPINVIKESEINISKPGIL